MSCAVCHFSLLWLPFLWTCCLMCSLLLAGRRTEEKRPSNYAPYHYSYSLLCLHCQLGWVLAYELPYLCTNCATSQLQLAYFKGAHLGGHHSHLDYEHKWTVSCDASGLTEAPFGSAPYTSTKQTVAAVLSVTAYVHETVPMFVVCTCTLLVSIHHLLQPSWFASTCSL